MLQSEWLDLEPKSREKTSVVPVWLAVLSGLVAGLFAILYSNEPPVLRPLGIDERAGIVMLLEGMEKRSTDLAAAAVTLRKTLDESILEVQDSSDADSLVEWHEGQLIFTESFFEVDPLEQEASLLSLVSRSSAQLEFKESELAILTE